MMARWMTVLVALLAQGMTLLSPACFVRCVAPNGQECVELSGEACHCCDCPAPEACAAATCGQHHKGEDHDEHDVPPGWQVLCEHCSCLHSPLESAPQVPSKSLISEARPLAMAFVAIPLKSDFDVALRALKEASLYVSDGSRPHAPPHLAVLATVILRV